jgi:hypothetical protein
MSHAQTVIPAALQQLAEVQRYSFTKLPNEILADIMRRTINYRDHQLDRFRPYETLVRCIKVCSIWREVGEYVFRNRYTFAEEHRKAKEAEKIQNEKEIRELGERIERLRISTFHADIEITGTRIIPLQQYIPCFIFGHVPDFKHFVNGAPTRRFDIGNPNIMVVAIPGNYPKPWKPSECQYQSMYEDLITAGFKRYNVPAANHHIARIYIRGVTALVPYVPSKDYCKDCNVIGHRPGQDKCKRKICVSCGGKGKHKWVVIDYQKRMCPVRLSTGSIVIKAPEKATVKGKKPSDLKGHGKPTKAAKQCRPNKPSKAPEKGKLTKPWYWPKNNICYNHEDGFTYV